MNVGRTPTELYDEMQPDYSASGMYSAHLGSTDRSGIRGPNSSQIFKTRSGSVGYSQLLWVIFRSDIFAGNGPWTPDTQDLPLKINLICLI